MEDPWFLQLPNNLIMHESQGWEFWRVEKAGQALNNAQGQRETGVFKLHLLLSGAGKWPGHQFIWRNRQIRFPTECFSSDTLCTFLFSNIKLRCILLFSQYYCRIPESESDPQRPRCFRLCWVDIWLQCKADGALLWRSRFSVVDPIFLTFFGRS